MFRIRRTAECPCTISRSRVSEKPVPIGLHSVCLPPLFNNGRKQIQFPKQCIVVGALAKLRKASISFVMPVSPSPCKNSAPTGRILVKVDTKNFSEVWRKCHEGLCAFMIISRWDFLRMRSVPNKRCRDYQSTHFCVQQLPPSKFGSFIKFTLVQALRLCTGSTAHRGSRCIAVLYRHWGSVQAVRSIGGVEV